jgi:hypothetical protein
MRSYRARLRERSERLVDPSPAPAAVVENRRLRNRVAELEDERDRLWAQVVRLQEELRSFGRREHVGERTNRQPPGTRRRCPAPSVSGSNASETEVSAAMGNNTIVNIC